MEPLKEIPEPALGAWRQTIRFGRDPFAFVSEVRREHGDLFRLHVLGMGRWVFVCTPALMAEIFKMSEDELSGGKARHASLGEAIGGGSSVSLDGEEYLKRRRTMTPFLSAPGARGRAEEIRAVVEESLARWPEGRPFAAQPFLDDISLRVIGNILWGPERRERLRRIEELARRFLDLLGSPGVAISTFHLNLGPLSPWGRFLKARRALQEALDAEVRDRLSGAVPMGEDLLAALIEALGAEDEASREAVLQETIGLVVGGAETTSKVLGWLLVETVGHRDVYARLQAEVDEVLGAEPLRANHLKAMPYLEAVVHEILRRRPPGPFAGPRMALKELRLGGYRVPQGTFLVQCLSETGKSDVFPRPHEFDPDNFFGRKVPMTQWIPFGGGSRQCTGMGLALKELPIALATTLQRLELESGGGSLRPVRDGIAFRPENAVRLRVWRRPGFCWP